VRSGCALGVCAIATLLRIPGTLPAQRSLEWPEVTGSAHRETDGTLPVDEQQVMRLIGDWNGGKRRCRVRSRQTCALRGMSRVDSLSRAIIQMVAGSLAGAAGAAANSGVGRQNRSADAGSAQIGPDRPNRSKSARASAVVHFVQAGSR
jgi:hypothetical protein